jgi:hypothetical protein
LSFCFISFFQVIGKNSYNPKGEVIYFNFQSAISSFFSLSTAYYFYPVSYPGFIHIRGFSVINSHMVFLKTMIILWIIYNFFGIASYLTLYNENKDYTILTFYPASSVHFISSLSICFSILFIIPLRVSHFRYTLMLYFAPKLTETGQQQFYIKTGVLFILIVILVSLFEGTVFTIVLQLANLTTISFQYIFPSVLYLKGFHFKKHIFRSMVSIFLLLLGIISILNVFEVITFE